MKKVPKITFTRHSFPQFNNDMPAYRAFIDGKPYLWGRTKQEARELSLLEYKKEGGRG